MKTKIVTAVGGMLLLVLSWSLPCRAANDNYMRNIYWERQEKAVAQILNAFRDGAPQREYVDGMYNLIQAETALMSYNVSFDDHRLLARLAKGLPKASPQIFGYRVFISKIRDIAGYDLGRPRETFEYMRANVQRRKVVSESNLRWQ